MEGRVVRPRFGRHPRLAILGPLEARLQRFDVLILSGLNEGTWPGDPPTDPWMSRPMRKAFGLPSPERRIGLAAHDIAQALCAPRVVLTRADQGRRHAHGALALAAAAGPGHRRGGFGCKISSNSNSRGWPGRLALTRPAGVQACDAPAPAPPVAARPRRLSVSEIEKWMRDPYSIYARHVLRLTPLDPLEQDPSAADYGSLIHDALQEFITAYAMGPLPADAGARLIAPWAGAFSTSKSLRPGIDGVLVAALRAHRRDGSWASNRRRRATLVQAHVGGQRRDDPDRARPAPFTLHRPRRPHRSTQGRPRHHRLQNRHAAAQQGSLGRLRTAIAA